MFAAGAGPAQRKICRLRDLCFMKAGCIARLVKTSDDRTWIIVRTRNAHRCDAQIVGI
jgi:hypothetical protein